jgi:glucose/arabinose dehydrogenase/cytochrome c2
MRIQITAAALVAAALAGPALGADAAAGKTVFQGQCALCHSAAPNDNGGGQGPSLVGVLGRKAADSTGFSYSKPLKESKLIWDAATLDRFLASPTTVVPGSAMVIPVADSTARANVIAYFQALKDGTYKDAPPPARGRPPQLPPAANSGPPKGEADWKQDAPGRRHRVDLAKLPAPYDTPSAAKFSQFVDKPANAKLSVPAGFKVEVFAKDLPGARNMRVAPNGDVFLSQTQTNRISVLRLSADGSRADKITTFAQGLNLPFGLALYPASDPQWLYVAETNRIVRYAYRVGDTVARGVPEVVVPQLYPGKGGGHFTRDIAFSLDGKRMFVSVGSESNVAEQMPKKTVAEAQAFEKDHALGSTWGPEEYRANVLVFDAARPGKPKIYATGIRNCVGLTVQPVNGELWCTTNERDALGDDLVPDYSTRVKEGAWYGWPWYFMGNHEDPRLAGNRPDLLGKATVPDVPYTAHSAALNLVFYTATSGASAFPKEYVGDGFAVLHGSWNRAFRTGHKVVRVLMKDGVPTGEYEDFLTGMIVDDASVWGRPVGAVVAKDGSLLISDDVANLVYRISTTH